MNRDTAEIKGLSDLDKILGELPEKFQRNVMRGAMRAGAKVIQTKAKELAPAEGAGTFSKYKQSLGWTPGELQRSIRLSAKLAGDNVVATVKAGNKKAYYAQWVEFGTAAHWIRPKGAKSLFIAGLFREAVHHPGARKNPFMRIAMDSQANAAVQRVADYIRARLTKAGIDTPDNGGDQ